jgi:bifunctional non-homologous end joining protein LigD
MPEIKAGETIIWLEPELVAEIKFAEWTKEGLLRQQATRACGDRQKSGRRTKSKLR